MPFTKEAARKIFNHIHGIQPFTIVPPMQLKLWGRGVSGSTSAELSIPAEVITFAEAVDRNDASRPPAESGNATTVRFDDFPYEIVVTGWRVYDSSPTPQSIWTGNFTRTRQVPMGDSFEIPPDEIRVELT